MLETIKTIIVTTGHALADTVAPLPQDWQLPAMLGLMVLPYLAAMAAGAGLTLLVTRR